MCGWTCSAHSVVFVCLYGCAAKQMLRTVYMPNEHADLLVLTMESLALQLEGQEGMARQKGAMMLEMRNTRAIEHKKRMLVSTPNHEVHLSLIRPRTVRRKL
jgi:hypothetical protein